MNHKTQPTAHAEITAPISADLRRIEQEARELSEPSPTAGMNLGQRILHVGGRENAAGYIEFGSVAAVRALVGQVLRDRQAAPPAPAAVAVTDEREQFEAWAKPRWPDPADWEQAIARPKGVVNNYILHGEWLGWQARAALAAAPAQAVAVPIELQGVQEAVEQGSGFWRSCTGCHELNEGHATGPVSKVFGCALGNGCSECGGIGAVWDDLDYGAMADAMVAPAQEHATQLAGQGHAYSIDADPEGIRARVAEAITGALASGGKKSDMPSDEHWLRPFWMHAYFALVQYNALRDSAESMLAAPAQAQEDAPALEAPAAPEWERVRRGLSMMMMGFASTPGKPLQAAEAALDAATEPGMPLSCLRALAAAPQAPAVDALDHAELQEIQRAVEQFADCGETDVDYALLMRAAQAGYLECTHFQVMNESALNLDAASAAQGSAA